MRQVLVALSLALVGGCGTTALREDPSWALADTVLDRSAEALAASTDAHIEAVRALRDQIVDPATPRTVEGGFELYNEMLMHLNSASLEARTFEGVHPDEVLREAGSAALQRVAAVSTGLALDRDLYQALAAIELDGLDGDTRFAIEKELRDYRRAGIDQPDNVRQQLQALDAELTELGQTFSRNNRDGDLEIRVRPEELVGMPADFIEDHPPGDDGLVLLTTRYTDYQPIARYCENDDVRRRLFLKYRNRAYPENKSVLEDLIAKRQEKARLLGYDTWADYATEDKMIATKENALAFIDRVATSARDAAAHEQQRLLEFKRREHPKASRVTPWESGFLRNRFREAEYDFDSKAVREYFDFERVRDGILAINEQLYGVRFEPVQGLDVWHESVSAWHLLDGDDLLGRFYLDLHPRDGKYNHAACFPYRTGVDGVRLPQATLVCNFPEGLMEFGQVETFFHEFGHLMHFLFGGRQRWMPNAGIATEWDFVEAPSQMLEEWMSDTDVLRSFAVHHETGEPIPAELVEKLRTSAEFGKASQTSQQMFYAAVSFHCYSRDPAGLDTDALVEELQGRYSPFPYIPNTHMQTSFGHLNGYSSNYYTYMWSEVIAKDMFTRFAEAGVMDTGVAADYRTQVLEPGGSKPAAQLVEDFLGRPYSFDAFEAWLGSSGGE